MKKMLFVYNPHAGKAQVRNNLSNIIETLSAGDYDVTVYPTKRPKDAQETVEQRGAEFDVVSCAGGDGTLDEVVAGIRKCGKNVPIGYIPAGSTNDFASSVGISSNMGEAARTIVEGKPFSCDIGAFNGANFVYVAAFGTFTEVSYSTPQATKNAIGHAAYILEALKKLTELQSFNLSIECDGEKIEDSFFIGMVTNATSVGGFKGIVDENVDLADGKLEVTFIRTPGNPLERNMLMLDMLNGTNDSGCVYRRQTSQIRVVCDERMSWTLDGEFGGTVQEARISCVPHAVEIIV